MPAEIELPRSRPPVTEAPETDLTESGNGGRDRINIAGDTITQATAHLTEEQRDLIRWVYGYAKDEDLGWKELESRFAISRSTFWKIFTDAYRNENGDRIDCSSICKTLGARKELIEKRENLRRVPFVETSIFEKIYKVALEARDMQVISLIYGESQIGKTEAQKEIQRRHNHGQTVYVRVPASAGVQWFIKEIAGQCHIKVRTSGDRLSLDGSGSTLELGSGRNCARVSNGPSSTSNDDG
jgi:hypothetical protein